MRSDIKRYRISLMQDKARIKYRDPKNKKTFKRRVDEIARRTSSSLDFNAMLSQLCTWLECSSVVETGTSLGLSAYSMAISSYVKRVHSLEGSDAIAKQARQKLEKFRARKVAVVEGLLRDTFPALVAEHQPQLVFLDADHRGSEVLFCYREVKSTPEIKCLIIHDIHWSADMYRAWKEITSDSSPQLCIDLYECGLVFFNQEPGYYRFLM